MRKGFQGLISLAESVLEQDPISGDLCHPAMAHFGANVSGRPLARVTFFDGLLDWLPCGDDEPYAA